MILRKKRTLIMAHHALMGLQAALEFLCSSCSWAEEFKELVLALAADWRMLRLYK
jgi:hypothetical protein